MDTSNPVLVVGGGPCAASAVHTLRSAGYEGDLVVVGDEPHDPYERPPLSKTFLSGEASEDSLAVLDAGWYSDNAVERRTERAVSIDPGNHTVKTDEGEIAYSSLLLATGGAPRRLPSDPPGIHYVRTIEDSSRLAHAIRGAQRVLVVGGGFLGCELAATATMMGAEVSLVELAPRILAPLPARFSQALQDLHLAHGVDLRTGTGVEKIDAPLARLTDGSVVEADVVVAALGIEPNDSLAAEAGIDFGDGVLVDKACRTSVPDVYAAGDVARHVHPSYESPVRIEHHDNALKQGVAAARAILGEEVTYGPPHWFWSDQFDHNLQHTGRTDDADDVVIRGSVAENDCTVFYLKKGAVRGAVTMDRSGEMRAALRLITGGGRPDPVRLAHDDLRQLVRDLRD